MYGLFPHYLHDGKRLRQLSVDALPGEIFVDCKGRGVYIVAAPLAQTKDELAMTFVSNNLNFSVREPVEAHLTDHVYSLSRFHPFAVDLNKEVIEDVRKSVNYSA